MVSWTGKVAADGRAVPLPGVFEGHRRTPGGGVQRVVLYTIFTGGIVHRDSVRGLEASLIGTREMNSLNSAAVNHLKWTDTVP